MSELKYKVGDIVKVIKDEGYLSHQFNGKVGTIIGVDENLHVEPEYTLDITDIYNFVKDELELVSQPEAPYKYGDILESPADVFDYKVQGMIGDIVFYTYGVSDFSAYRSIKELEDNGYHLKSSTKTTISKSDIANRFGIDEADMEII